MICDFNVGYKCSLDWSVAGELGECHICRTTSYRSYEENFGPPRIEN